MSNINAITPLNLASLKDVHEAIGVTQYVSLTNWYQTIGGLLIQGGLVEAAPADAAIIVPFNVGFNKQILGIFIQAIYTPAGAGNENTGMVHPTFTLSQWTLVNDGVVKDFFWWAIGT
jgi:hypothetical protein